MNISKTAELFSDISRLLISNYMPSLAILNEQINERREK